MKEKKMVNLSKVVSLQHQGDLYRIVQRRSSVQGETITVDPKSLWHLRQQMASWRNAHQMDSPAYFTGKYQHRYYN